MDATITVSKPFSMLIRPVAQTDEIVAAWQNYQELKGKLLNDNDYQAIQGKRCIKKSGWRKLQTAFGISDELVKEERRDYKGYFSFEVMVKVSAQNGRYAYGVGSCASNERNFSHVEHDTRSTAHTRAKNRAVSDLIGGGEVSAEEMMAERVDNDIENLAPVTYGRVATAEPTDLSQNWMENRVTEKQEHLLRSLIIEKVFDESERERELSEISTLTKSEASSAISVLLSQC